MKIVMTNTADHTRKVVSFDEACSKLLYLGSDWYGMTRRWINYKLLNNEVIADDNLEFKREIN